MDCDSLRPQYLPTINFLLRHMEHLIKTEVKSLYFVANCGGCIILV